jgi:PBP1b-binding outer membrane lipoprotein LpoB
MNRHATRAALVAALAATTAIPLAAVAGPHSGTAGYRVNREQQRIDQGERSGQLTTKGASRDQARLNAINAQREADLKANGGHLTDAEKAQLQGELNRSSGDLYFGKHNAITKPGVKPPSRTALPKLPSAGTAGYVGDRVARQEDRLRNGMSSGQLTRAEYARDTTRLQQIDAQREADLKANNGTLTEAEKAQLNSELDASSTGITSTRHNGTHQQGN